jgi:Family of unknown function (DUF5681)
MTKKSPPRNPPSGSEQAPETGASYAVGYGKPPRQNQFPPGVSGNPKGRPKGKLNLATVLQTELNRTITVREGDRSRRLKKGNAWIVRTVNGALNNDAKAAATLISLLRANGMIDERPDDIREAPLTQNDAALVADFLQRQFDASGQPEGSEDDPPKLKPPGTDIPTRPQEGEAP